MNSPVGVSLDRQRNIAEKQLYPSHIFNWPNESDMAAYCVVPPANLESRGLAAK